MSGDDDFDWDEYLIAQELRSPESGRHFRTDPEEFAYRARSALSRALTADGRLVLSLVLESVLVNPVWKGKNSGQARLAKILALVFDEPGRGGRPRRPRETILRYITEGVLRTGRGVTRTIESIALEAVEEVTGEPDEALAKRAADEFSSRREELVSTYRESGYAHGEGQIASVIVDLLAAAGLQVDPLITAPIHTDPNLSAEVSAAEWEGFAP